MKANSSMTSLDKLLHPIYREVRVDPEKEYRLLGVRWYGEGLFVKDLKSGQQIKADRLYRVQTGDFIYNRLFAWRGSFAIVGEDANNSYVSNEFPCFGVNTERLDIKFLLWYLRREAAWSEALGLSSGATPTSRNRLKEQHFLALEIPLPPLPDQRRIVARIEELAAKITEARSLRQRAVEEAEALLIASLRTVIINCQAETIKLEDLCSAIIDNLHSNPRYAETGIPCIRSPDVGYGTLNLERALRTDESEYQRRTVRGEPQANDIVLVREGGGTGKCALVLPGQRFSLGQRVMMLRPNPKKVLPLFFLYQLLSPLVQEDQILPLSKGSASPHLNIGALKQFNFRLPSLPEQHHVITYLSNLQSQVDALKHLQAQTAAELDALLPAILDKAFKEEL